MCWKFGIEIYFNYILKLTKKICKVILPDDSQSDIL